MAESGNMEKSLVLIKPDAMKKKLYGLVMHELANTGLKLIGAKIVRVSRELAEKHYAEHKGKPFYNGLLDFITGKLGYTDSVIALVYEGEDAVRKIRQMAGATNPMKAEPDTIRGRFGRVDCGIIENVMHASDSPESGEREVKLWFKPGELVQ
jgi:nucleoside-diphosphate kinase